MENVNNNASFCVIAPAGAQGIIESMSKVYSVNGDEAVSNVISRFPDAISVKKHLHDVLNGSGKVAIHFDQNATTWSVQPVLSNQPDTRTPNERLTAARLDPQEFERYRLITQMTNDRDLAMEDKKLAFEEKKLVIAQATELALADKVTKRELELADKVTQRELELADKITERELALHKQPQAKNHPPRFKSAPSPAGKRELELLVHDVPATKKRRILQCENVSKLVIDKISEDWHHDQWPCSLLALYHIVYAEFKSLPRPSSSIYHEQVPRMSHHTPDESVPFFCVLWTVVRAPRRGVVSQTIQALVRRMIGWEGPLLLPR